MRRSILLMSASLLLLVAVSTMASADPDPPVVDGGNFTFEGDWTVDPGDHLVYVNQTIMVNGNVTISPGSSLDLVNCTLYLNGTPPTEYPRGGLRVGTLGTLNITSGSLVRALFLDYFRVDPGAHLLVEDSTVANIGHTAYLEMSGFYIQANDTVIRRSTIRGGNHGLLLDGVNGCVVEDVEFIGPQRNGVYLLGGTSGVTLLNITLSGQMSAISILDCQDIILTNVSIALSGYGMTLNNGTATVLNAVVRDIFGGVVYYTGSESVHWVVDGTSSLVNSTLRLNGTLEVVSGGAFTMVNSTLAIDNPVAHGVSGIIVRSGGSMVVSNGSSVRHVEGGSRYKWMVESGGRLDTHDALVEGAGWDPSFPGLVLISSGNRIDGTTFSDCHYGVSVRGDGNVLHNTTFDACQVGAWVAGSDALLTDLAFRNGTLTGLVVEGARNVTVIGAGLTGPTAFEAVNVTASQDILIEDVNVTGSVSYGIRFTYVSDARVVGVAITASVRCISIEQGPYARSSNITIENGTLQGPFPLEVLGVVGLDLLDLNVQGGSVGVASLNDVTDLDIVSCNLGQGSAVGLVAVVNATMDLCQLDTTLEVRDSEGLTLNDCFFQTVTTGILGDNVTGMSAWGITMLDVTDGIVLIGCTDATLGDSLFTNVMGSAIWLYDISGAIVTNVSIVSSQVGANITGGANCSLRELTLFNVARGVVITGVAAGHELVDSNISSIPVAVMVGTRSNLNITGCSFYDCAMAIDGHPGAEVGFRTGSSSEVVNSTCRMRGWFTVTAPGELNLTASTLEFMGVNASDSGIVALPGSTLRMTQGTVVRGAGGTFSILANGSLVLRSSSIVGGGEVGGTAAVESTGPAAVLVNVTFKDCGLALALNGSDATLSRCAFSGNRQSVLLDGAQRPRITDCSFVLSNNSWDIQGTFGSNLQILECSFEGGGVVPIAIGLLDSGEPSSVLSMRNVSISNYTSWGLQDDHRGNVIMSGCSITSASVFLGKRSGDAATLSDLHIRDCSLELGSSGLTISHCVFTNASLKVHGNSGGSLISQCSFSGVPVKGGASIEVDGSIRLTFRELDLSSPGVGIRISGSSDVTLIDIVLQGASGTALEVNGSIVRLESCALSDLEGTGIRVWNVGSRLECRNGTVSASQTRTGYDVDASSGGDAWLLNTTFDRTSVLSTSEGRVEVLWHVSVEPVLPWGGILWDPDYLAVEDASGVEVVNVSSATGLLRLYEFSEVNGARTSLSPHTFNVSDQFAGVWFHGTFGINSSTHLLLELVDVATPVARAGPDQVVDEDAKVTLDATGSSDNDLTFLDTGSFRWSFDEYGSSVVLDDDVVSYVFSVPGKYWVNLTVWDLAGNVGRDLLIIQVRDRTPPVIRFGGNVTLEEEEWNIFDASATTDNDPTFDFTTGRFLWSIDLGRELLERGTATFGHAFSEPGNYSGTLSVWDNAGNLAQESFWVAVGDVTPPVIVGVTDATVFEPTVGLLDASACQDNVGIVSYHWSLTFHNWTGGPDGHELLEGMTPIYSFDRLGSYTVTLTIEDAAGNVNSTDISVVYDDPPIISVPSWVVSMVGERLQVPVQVSDVYYTDLVVTVLDGMEGPNIVGTPPGTSMVWTPGDDVAGEDVTITLGVHDGFISSQATITVHVNPARGEANSAPVITSSPPLSSKRDTPYIYTVDATDPDGDVLGYALLVGPEGMSISQRGTVSWDPAFVEGTQLVDVHLSVTDGMDSVDQSWTIRWREPPNSAPLINFQLEPVEVRVMEEFAVDLSVYLQDPEAFEVDADDPNYLLTWGVSFDEGLVSLLSRDGLVFRFQTLEVRGTSTVNFTATDPSGAFDTTAMDLVVRGREPPPADGDDGRLMWILLAVLVAVGTVGGAVAYSRRRRRVTPEDWDGPEKHGIDLGPPPDEEAASRAALEAALASEGASEVGAFVELDGKGPEDLGEVPREPTTAPAVTRVITGATEGPKRAFSVEGVAVLEANGKVLASTGTVEDLIGPYAASVEEVRKGLRGDGTAVLEMEGRRVVMALRSGLGAICIIRGKEDEAFRSSLRDNLGNLLKDRSTEGALGVLEDVLASAGPAGTAEVIHDAWTTRLGADLSYQGSVVLLDVRLVNDTDHILNNVRLRLHHDEDALTVQSVTPKLLTTHGRMALGNIPPRKEHKVAISLIPEICMSSIVRVMATYTDMEGRTVQVPSPTINVRVECPHIEAGGEIDEERLLNLSERGLGISGRRVFDHGMDVDHRRLYKLAVGLVSEQGPMKVIDLVDDSLMRAEAWFLGSGQGGTPQVLVRVSSHGADHLLDVFVTSDNGEVATGLLTHIGGELLDRAASEMPGKRVERVRDSATLEEISVWPSLLDYKVMGD